VIQHISDKWQNVENLNDKERLRQQNELEAGFNRQFDPDNAAMMEAQRK
jgi:hypothetical protein